MKNTGIVLALLCVLFAAFLGGFFLGRNVNASEVQLSRQPEPTTVTGSTPPSSAPAQTGSICLNTATALQLQTLPGIGPTLAQRIIDYRTANGPFTATEQLMLVEGIGEKRFEAIKDYLTLEETP
jgi:competence protein ComEA